MERLTRRPHSFWQVCFGRDTGHPRQRNGMGLATAMTHTCKKQMLRQEALDARSKNAASRDGSLAAARLKDNFFSAFDLQSGQSFAAYWPFRDEIDVRSLFAALEAMGCNCLLPVMIGRKEPLQFHQWKPGDVLESSRFGMLEPSKFHPSTTPNVVILPLLASGWWMMLPALSR